MCLVCAIGLCVLYVYLLSIIISYFIPLPPLICNMNQIISVWLILGCGVYQDFYRSMISYMPFQVPAGSRTLVPNTPE